jgi:geranylgeranyl transferase type-2 subunit beta
MMGSGIRHCNTTYAIADSSASVPAYLTTRRDAIVTYVKALQAPEGYFHGWLEAPPPFALDGTSAGYSQVLDAYETLSYINQLSSLDWDQTKNFLATLVDTHTGLLNLTGDNGPNVGTCWDAVTFYADIGLESLFNDDAIAEFAASFQQSSGGFDLERTARFPTLIGTYFGLSTLQLLGKMNLIDTQKAKEFVMSCYNESGWYANIPKGPENIFVTAAGIVLSDILGISNEEMRNKTAAYLMQNWDALVGADTEHDLYITERIVWSLDLLDRKDLIDTDKMFNWVLGLQKHWNGAFVGYPEADIDQERLVNVKYAMHILSMYNGTSLLDDDFSVLYEPVWEIPQWWIDYINEEWSTTTALNGNQGYFMLPDFSVMLEYMPLVLLASVLCIPAVLIVARTKSERNKRRQMKRDRKNQRKGSTT